MNVNEIRQTLQSHFLFNAIAMENTYCSSNTPHSADRALRLTTALTFLPTLALLVPYGVKAEAVVPALGLVPLFFSAILGFLLYSKPKWPTKAPRTIAFLDVFCCMFLLSIMIPGWVFMARCNNCWWKKSLQPGLTMFGSYGMVGMMVNFVIHSFFILRYLALWLRSGCGLGAKKTCPHCHGDLRQRIPRLGEYQHVAKHDDLEAAPDAENSGRSSESRESWDATPRASASEDRLEGSMPRESTDDESAKLIDG